ncbi:S8 family serine peptidase [Paenibacillus xerothermodurans]|uniref:SLH domain-containing protein n=1 Tax=Paenibacillus xerothermodurans TaxID=1977292 RepID=A0A2W1N672_PAEXE|nr:S8 family serine peptidase [Paenibacillus xerothermodurans]PZE20149.1 hypothetical protein CBW46_014750 [Paenibacillus xerothermodurans]
MKQGIIRLGMSVSLILSSMTAYITEPLPARAQTAPSAEVASAYIVPGKVMVKLKEDADGPTARKIRGYSAQSVENQSPQHKVVEVPTASDIPTAVKQLENNPDVEYAEPVFVNKMTATPSQSIVDNTMQAAAASLTNDPEAPNQWSLSVTDVTYAWEKVPAGNGEVIIAVLDTGVDGSHPDLRGKLVDGYDFIHNRPISPNANSDDNMHGTFVAGIAAAHTNNAVGIAGVAGSAKIMPLKVLDSEGSGNTDTIGQAIRWAVDHGAKVINLSLGRPREAVLENGHRYDLYSQYERDSIQYAVSKGAVVIASSGNESNHWAAPQPQNLDTPEEERANPDLAEPYYSAVGYPAALPNTIAVGAIGAQVNGELNIADFSNIGPELDVVAPGALVRSTIPATQSNRAKYYDNNSGTSFSAPFVSGMAALLLTASPGLTPSEVEAALENSASAAGLIRPESNNTLSDRHYFGRGLVNAKRAFGLNQLKLVHTSGNLTAKDTLGFALESRDYAGAPAANYDKAAIVVAAYDAAASDYVEVNRTVVESTYFSSFQVPMNDAGAYRIYAEVNDPQGALQSGSIEARIMPDNVMANKTSGSYKGTISVELSSPTSEADIFYTLDGSDPTAAEDAALYQGPIQLSQSTTLRAVAVKRDVASGVSSYEYTITKSGGSKRGGGGGGGGTFFMPPATTPPGQSNTATVVVKADDAQLKSALESAGTTSATIDATAGVDANQLRVQFGAAIVELAEEKNKSLIVNTGRHVFELPPGAVAAEAGTDVVTLSVSALASDPSLNHNPAEARDVSKPYDFSLSSGDSKITQFDKPLAIRWQLPEGVSPAKLGVYGYNQSGLNWSYLGGTTNGSTISFMTDHFSKFAVFEYNKTFDDMAEHWARAEVEQLAAKHIVTGVTDTTFGPEQQLTRAEFAALLVRMLGTTTMASTDVFTDVNPTDWYHDVVYQAYHAGVIEGVAAGTFAPNQPITREQMAVMIMRAYSTATGKPMGDIVVTQEVKFIDEGQIGGWARSSVRLVNGLGLMDGFPDGSFKPVDTATRAQAAAVIQRLMDAIQQ